MEAIMRLPLAVDFGFLRSWLFWRKILCALLIVMLPICVIGCSVAQVQADIAKVIQLLPSVAGIVTSVLSILAAARVKTSNAGTVIATGMADVGTLANDILGVLKTYQSNIAAMPPTVLNQLDQWIAALQGEITTLQAQFPQIPTNVVTALNVAFTSVEAILGYLAVILPAPAAQAMFPRSFPALSAAGVKFGNASTVVIIPSQRDFASTYNRNMRSAGFKHATIHENWKWHVIP